MTGSDGDRDLVDLARAGPVVPPPDDAEVERAIASVPGVSSASLRRDPDTGRTRLRLRLRAGEDAEQAAWSIAATLRERFGIALDPASIRPVAAGEADEPELVGTEQDAGQDQAAPAGPGQRDGAGVPETPMTPETPEAPETTDPTETTEVSGTMGAIEAHEVPEAAAETPPPSPPSLSLTPPPPPRATAADPDVDVAGAHGAEPAAASPPEQQPDAPTAAGGGRATIHRLDIERGAREVRATVALLRGDQAAQGVARAVPTTRSILRAIAEATASALQQFMTAPLLIGIDRIEVEPAADPAHVLVGVTLLADRGEEQLLGVSLVRGDAERAVVRATLDALNRRVSPFLDSVPERAAAS